MLRLSAAFALIGVALLLFSLAPASRSTATSPSDAAYGKALFAAKGCVQCHHHAAVSGSGQFAGGYGAEGAPDLTNRRFDPTYLRRWLKNPSAVKPNTAMPTLGLSDDEIEALVAFLNAPPSSKG